MLRRGGAHGATRALLSVLCGAVVLLGAGCSVGDDDTRPSQGTTATRGSATSDPSADLVGSGCADYAKQVPSGAGSIRGMARDPVAIAANNNPLLTTLVRALSGKLNPGVKLVDTIDHGQLTVFAPTDDAFAKLPAATVKKLSRPASAARLRTILTTHVVRGQKSPSSLDGTLTTLAGNKITVKGSGDNITVGGAAVVCGGIRTANATVYLIDSVLDPAGGHF